MSSNEPKRKSLLTNLEKGCAITASIATILGFCLVVFIFFTGKEFFPQFFKPSKPNTTSQQSTEIPQPLNINAPTSTAETQTNNLVHPTMSATTASTETIPWQGKYYANTEFREPPAFTRNDDALVFDWGKSNPAPNLPIDNFTIRWKKCTEFEERYYTFTARTKYYSLVVLIDGIEIMDVRNGAESLDYYMASGNHCIVVDYYHTLYEAYVYFNYE